ncbi:MAG: hypothetical protein JEZ07_09100 [Phycisphaerae bacterium]|nr:hypothetical protein [Phycisphaerae bacterium]
MFYLRKSHITILLTLLLSMLYANIGFAADKTTTEEKVKVPLLINVLKGVTITKAEIDEIVKEANKVAKKAGIQLEFDKDKHIKTDVSDEGSGTTKDDGKIASSEDTKLDKKGQEELNSTFGNGQGIKVYITNEIHGSPNTMGLAPHSKPVPKTTKASSGSKPARTPPVIYIKKNNETNAAKGNDLAHEAFHVLTLGKGHAIDSGKGKYADNTWHSDDPNNAMYPHNPYIKDGKKKYRGSDLTPEQIKEIKKTAKTLGKTVTVTQKATGCDKSKPVVNKQHAIQGCIIDDLEEITTAICDIHTITLFATNNYDTLYIDVMMSGSSNLGDVLDMGMNLDILGGLQSNQILVEILPEAQTPLGMIPNTMPGAQITVWHSNGPELTYLPGCFIGQSAKLHDTIEGEMPVETDYQNILHLEIPMEILGLDAPVATIHATVFDHISGEFDEVAGFLEIVSPPGQQLILSNTDAFPGELIQLEGNMFMPNELVSIYADDELLTLAETDPEGNFFAEFLAPPLPCDDYFITARCEESSVYDFTILKVSPHEGDVNQDNRVDILDVAVIANNWLWYGPIGD